MSTAYSAASVIIPAQGGGGKAGTLYGWRPDVNQLQDIDVLRNTTASRVNEAGLIEFVGVNVPRFDWGEGGSCPSLLVEPERTNLLLRSEEFDNAYWTKSFSTITANDEIAPDGTMTADKIEGTSTSFADATNVITTSSNVVHVGSVFIKKDNDETRFPELELRDLTGANFIAVQINTKTGETGIRTQSGNAGFFTPILINGYWKVSAYCLNVSNIRFLVRAAASDTLGGLNVNTTGSIYAWGAQLEVGSYPTSYIKTVASQETRNADVISKTGIASLIGQTEGTLFVQLNADGLAVPTRSIFYLTANGTTANRVAIQYTASGQIQAIASSGGSTQGNVVYTITGPCKAAFAYNASSYEFFVNGVSRGTFSGSLPSSLIRLDIGHLNGLLAELGGTISQAALYKTRLTNDELAALTTL